MKANDQSNKKLKYLDTWHADTLTHQTTPNAPYPIGLSGSMSSGCCKRCECWWWWWALTAAAWTWAGAAAAAGPGACPGAGEGKYGCCWLGFSITAAAAAAAAAAVEACCWTGWTAAAEPGCRWCCPGWWWWCWRWCGGTCDSWWWWCGWCAATADAPPLYAAIIFAALEAVAPHKAIHSTAALGRRNKGWENWK